MLELHSGAPCYNCTVGSMLELHSEHHVRTAQWANVRTAMLELHSGAPVRIAQWGAMLELHSGAPC